MSKGDALTIAVQATDLPLLISELYPDSKAKPGVADVYYASWRGNDESPALSVNKRGKVWLWKDHATDEGGNAFDFLVEINGLAKHEAARFLIQRAGIPDEPSDTEEKSLYRPIPEDALKALWSAKSVPMLAMKGRGFNKSMLERYGIVAAPDNPDDALIPITSPDGVVLQVKRRRGKPGKFKYSYEHKGYHGPPWCSDNSRDANTLLIVEGELNGIVAHASLEQAGETDVGVMGIAGAEAALFDGLAMGKHVMIYADDDKPGRDAVARWQDEARDQGARSVFRLQPQPMDFCDYAGQHGRPALAALLGDLRNRGVQVYGALDRMVGTYSVRELIDSAKRYISGAVIHPTGIDRIDKETGGIRESGLYGVAGLSSMGKSSFMRRILLEEVRAGGIVRVYSPDQGPAAIYRLLASLLSDVGSKELRTGTMSKQTIERYGTLNEAMASWQRAYQYVVTELSSRFQVSESGSLREISKDMERAVDQGVTMFGIDYLQMLRSDGKDAEDGEAAQDLEVQSHRMGVPIIGALQLAKYKFPPSRRNALPTANDIHGSGSYFHSSEMLFMVFNDSIYLKKYAGPEYEAYYDPPTHARVLLRKDKEGEGDLNFAVHWEGRLAAFKEPSRLTPEDERKGLVI